MDPYALGPGTGTFQPALPAGSINPSGTVGAFPPSGVVQPPPPLVGGQSPGIFGGSPVVVPSTTIGAGSGFATPYPPAAFPSGTPSTLFPNGFRFGNWAAPSLGGGFNAYQLLHGPRLRHTFINNGSGPFDLEINDTDTSIAFAFPEFLYSSQPLFVVPSFSLHLWSGPQGFTGSDLPPNAYSGFLDLGWQTDPNKMLGMELGVRLGAFTDFNTFNNDSFQVRGKGLGSFRVAPSTTFKLGVYYLNRNRIKILPAGGFLCQPSPFSRFDIFFYQHAATDTLGNRLAQGPALPELVMIGRAQIDKICYFLPALTRLRQFYVDAYI